ncbi:uncharacterized protein LOC126750161 [Anthonomus grandis grandis]|uniref:uncharacterized protein LOC126750161 n=1 Tax=Anthonomus grandis grandis TaxID=2921223 RepID=UPI0021655842|nr:uncharacterized protein LOC126750161 [Anthonomus grandis grandis]
MTWTDEETLAFIDMYRVRSSLWNSSNSDYKNKNRRHDGLTEIAVSFGIEKQEVERKIKNLQSHFSRERKKELESKKTGSGTDEAYVSKWFAYQAMLFLTDKNKPRKTVDNIEDSVDYDEGEKDLQEEDTRNGGEVQGQVSTQPSTSQEKQAAAETPT